ncbi:hypothetical protein Tsubulata_026859 [Turnera subulata]|uniref:PWWP domain-containing protein n=1 Tax=Turnera subulata TaxID=218843 RepID=A0A9Q0G9U7_9ROSI|nr:hypothetical protein Tsubulata_026859 [Turnera subulata]
MGEGGEEDVTVSGVKEPSSVTVSEDAAAAATEKPPAVDSGDTEAQEDGVGGDGEKTPAAESVSGEVKKDGQEEGRVEGSSSENVAAEEGGSGSGGDVMVGVVGSDVYVDGVSLRQFGDGSGEKMSQEAPPASAGGSAAEEGTEKDVRGSDGGGAAVDDMAAEEVKGDAAEEVKGDAVEASDKGTEGEGGVSSMVVESEKGGKSLEGGDGGGQVNDVVDDKASAEVGDPDSDAKGVELGSHVDATPPVEGSSSEGPQAENVAAAEKEQSAQEGSVKEDVEKVETNAVENMGSMEVEVVEEDVRNQKVENQAEGASVAVDSSAAEPHSVVEKAELAMDDVESREVEPSEKDGQDKKVETGVGGTPVAVDSSAGEAHSVVEKAELADDSLKQSKQADESREDSIEHSEVQRSDVPHSEVQNSEAETNTDLKTSSTILKVPNEATTAVEVETVVIASKDHLQDKAEASNSDAVEGAIASSERDSIPTEKDATPQIASKPLEEQTQVAVEGNVTPMDSNDITCPSIEGMDTDAFNENFCFSVEELQATFETVNGSTENGYNAFADPQSLNQSAHLVGGEVTATESKMLFYSEKDKNLIVEECLDQKMSHNSSGTHSKEDDVVMVDALPETESKIPSELNLVAPSNTATLVQVDSNTGQHMKIQELASEGKILEQNLELATVNGSTDTQVLDGGETAKEMDGKSLVHDEAHDVLETGTNAEQSVDEHVDAERACLHEGHHMEVEEQDTDICRRRTAKEKAAGSLPKIYQAKYQLPPEDEGVFSVSDLVWGKVRSHPWWPGQIFDAADASDKAMKYHKKDCFLVAYFGDKTFAWNEASLLKPFRSHFSQVEKVSSSESFQNAVDCALEELSRRVELGLTCSCLSKDIYEKIKFQIVENAGIREESSTRDAVDKSAGADLFDPDKLVEYVRALAQCPSGGADRLELEILKSQLKAFNRLKGYSELPEFLYFEGLENIDGVHVKDEMTEQASSAYEDNGQILSGQESVQTQRSSYNKRKHNLKDGIYPRKKEKSMSELMGETWDSVDDVIGSDGKGDGELISPSSAKRRKGSESFADDLSSPEGRKTISLAKVSATTTCNSKPSFKIGECIQRVASQMTGATSIFKGNNQKLDGSSDGLGVDGSDANFQLSEDADIKKMAVPAEYSSLDELILQLHLVAQDPLKGYSFVNIIASFFSDFRNSVLVDQSDKVAGKRRKSSNSLSGFPETFEFEDMNDTYWTDRVIQNGSEEQPPRKSRKKDNIFVPVILDKPSGRGNSRKRYSEGNYDASAQKPVGYVDENAPAELVMHFPVVDSVPSEANLNKMFKHFGPINESETEVDRDTNRARVVFKKCSDAEAAYGSAPKFNIFGATLVNYQLNYVISVPFKTPPADATQFEEDATLFLQY